MFNFVGIVWWRCHRFVTSFLNEFHIPGGAAVTEHPDYLMAASQENLLMINTEEDDYQTKDKDDAHHSQSR